MSEAKPPKRPRPVQGDSSDVLRYLHALEDYTTRIEQIAHMLQSEAAIRHAMLSLLRGACLNLLDQLAFAQGDDESYLWRIGGRPLDEAYKALRIAVDRTKASEG